MAYIFIFSSNFSFDLVDIDYSYQILLAGFIIGLALNFTSTFSLSEDVYRYLFDGFLIQKNINPYLTAPSMISTSITSQFPFYALINNPEVSSPYPPLSIAFSYIYVVLFGFNPIGWLIVINLVTTLTGFILIKILKYLDINKHVIILWSLNPNILFDFNSSGHNDIFTILFLSLSIYFLIRKSENQNVWLIVAGLCFSFSIGLKLFTFLMFPFLIKWFKKSGSFIVILLTSLQFFVFYVLINLNFSGIVIFLKYWRFNGGLFELFYFIFNDFNSSVNNLFLESNLRIIFALIFILSYFIIIVIFYSNRNKYYSSFPKSLEFIGYSYIVLFVLSPVLHPWYVLWPIIPIILTFRNKFYPYWLFLFVINFSYLYYLNFNWYYYILLVEYLAFYVSLIYYSLTNNLIENIKNTFN